LNQVDARVHEDSIAKADRWLLALKPKTTPEAAAVLFRTSSELSLEWRSLRSAAVEYIQSSQNSEGGWGPYRTSPPETFDTALALLALVRAGDSAEISKMIQRGRAFLVAEQYADGSWPETTRPTGGKSYAQRISTTGWATMALLRTAK
jgi:squalene cyclase